MCADQFKKRLAMEKQSRMVLFFVIFLVIITGTVIAVDMQMWRGHRADEIKTFQRATGGLGIGAIATPIWQFINYDSRVLSVDDSITWPVPGGYSYGPDRTGAVSYFDEIPEDQWIVRVP
jgi:hypothetical protein